MGPEPTRPSIGRTYEPRLVNVLLPDFDRADGTGEFYGNPMTPTFAELLTDAEANPYLRTVLVGMLRKRTEFVNLSGNCNLSATSGRLFPAQEGPPLPPKQGPEPPVIDPQLAAGGIVPPVVLGERIHL